MDKPEYRVDPSTGALIFTPSSEAEMLQSLHLEIKILSNSVEYLVGVIQELSQEIKDLKIKH